MNVIVLQVFVGLMLVAFALLLLAFSVKHGDHEHADRLSLLPLEEDPAVARAVKTPDRPPTHG
jgi:hypothetical protein